MYENQAKELLELLLSKLSLGPKTEKLIRQVFQEVVGAISNLQNNLKFQESQNSPPELDVIEDYANNLSKLLAFFSSADTDRLVFLSNFPQWMCERKKNIDHLREIAAAIHESRKLCSVAQIVGGSVGIVGGAAIIGSLLFPPALAVTLPAFMGGAAVSSALAVGGGIAAGAGGVTQVATSVTEVTLLHKRIKRAKEICTKDREHFERLMGWFQRTQELEMALQELFGINILDIIFNDLKAFFGLEYCFGSAMFRSALRTSVGNIIQSSGSPQVDPSLKAAVISVVFVAFLIQRQNRFLYQCVMCTHRLGFGMATCFDTNVQIGRLVASACMKNKEAGELIPKVLARKVAVGALTGLGMALDAANIVLNSVDLAKGSRSEEQRKLTEVADQLQQELDSTTEIFYKLLRD